MPSHVEVLSKAVTTAADGSATTYTDHIPHGRLSQIRYVKTDFADGSTITITDEATGATLWAETGVNASAARAPRQPTHGTDGVASLYAAGGAAVRDLIALANTRIKIVIANGGNAKTGTFHFTLI